MNFLSNWFPKKPSKDSVEAHKVVDKKAGEAQNILREVQKKMEQTANQIDEDRKRTNKEMARKVKEIRDVASQIAVVTGSIS